MKKKTKIICTIGPASLTVETLREMYEAGMNAARINTAYGDMDQYELIVENIRETADIPVILDIKGPEIRLNVKRRRRVKKGETIAVGFHSDAEISFNHRFYDEIDVGDAVYIDNGRIKTQVAEKKSGVLRLLVMEGGVIDDGKGVNIPNKHLSVPSLTEEDLEIIEFAKEHDVEYVALSFTRSLRDVEAFKAASDGFRGGVIAKIENSEGLKNFAEILKAVDCIMIARGDLGVEIELERVPLIQKSIIAQCNQVGKTVVTATEMLESMIHQAAPTRAEVSDVANAILDGTDAVMLSGETSIGKYPVESVRMMARIAAETERAARSSIEAGGFINISDAISKAIRKICESMPIDKVVTLTRSGYTARMIARFKIPQFIIAVTPYGRVKRQLELVFGVYPVRIDYRDEEDRILAVAESLHAMNLIRKGETVLFTAAFRTAKRHASNLIEIHDVDELLNLSSSKKPDGEQGRS
jgi:pyruvate kinase